MKGMKDALTPEQQEQLKDVYVIVDDNMVAVMPDNEPTAETLKIFDLDWQIKLTAEDFERDGSDFVYNDEANNMAYICEDNMPDEVVEVLNEVIEAREGGEE